MMEENHTDEDKQMTELKEKKEKLLQTLQENEVSTLQLICLHEFCGWRLVLIIERSISRDRKGNKIEYSGTVTICFM